MVLDMIRRLIPHLHVASDRTECCMETVVNSRTTLVNTFGVYWTKRGDLYNPATRCAIVHCMTDFVLVCTVLCCSSQWYILYRVLQSPLRWFMVFRLH